MTVTEDQTTTSAKQDGVRYEDDGTITFVIEGKRNHLRAPRFGEFKRFKREAFRVGKEVVDLAEELRQKAEEEKEGSGDVITAALAIANSTGISLEVEEIVDRSTELTNGILKLMFDTLADWPLPEDQEEWPTWLVTGEQLIAKMLNHWRTVPLGRG
jgi:NTP pyrophosphatase (non-canonical NTP hydrolase)